MAYKSELLLMAPSESIKFEVDLWRYYVFWYCSDTRKKAIFFWRNCELRIYRSTSDYVQNRNINVSLETDSQKFLGLLKS